MNYYYIDYENVKTKGLNGISKLTPNDIVKIFYSKDAETITFGLHRRIMDSKAQFEYKRIDNNIKSSLKNALDVFLLDDLSKTIKQKKNERYYGVSKDSDYNTFIENEQNDKISIYKIDEICKQSECGIASKNIDCKGNNKAKDNLKEQRFRSSLRRKLAQEYEDYKEETVEAIVEAYMTAGSKQELNNLLQKSFDNKGVSELMSLMRDFTKDLPGRRK